jgi:hypothetical protein
MVRESARPSPSPDTKAYSRVDADADGTHNRELIAISAGTGRRNPEAFAMEGVAAWAEALSWRSLSQNPRAVTAGKPVNSLSDAAVSSCGKGCFRGQSRAARVGENGRVTLFAWPLAFSGEGLRLMS